MSIDYVGYGKSINGEILAGAGGTFVGLGLGYLAGRRSGSKKTRRRQKHTSRVSRKRNRRGKGRRFTPHTAGKRKDTSHKRIRYTKRGQPYIIRADGKARFISMRSAGSSHKRKGGKY